MPVLPLGDNSWVGDREVSRVAVVVGDGDGELEQMARRHQ
jgi:hypothetical protein